MSTLLGISNMGVSVVTNSMKSKNKTGISSVKIKKASTKKRKRLQYNFKEISRMIMRAKTSVTARQTVTKAKVKVAELRRKLWTDQYDYRELQNAIIHAEQMERIAKKKVKHLQEEERAYRHSKTCEGEIEDKKENKKNKATARSMERQYSDDGYCIKGQAKRQEDALEMRLEREISWMMMKQHIQEMKQMNRKMAEASDRKLNNAMSKTMSDMKDITGIDELSDSLMSYSDDIDPVDLEMLKRKHRIKEMKEITEADMKYLKAMFDRLQSDKQSVSSGSVNFDMGEVDMDMAMIATTPVEAPVMVECGSVDVML